MNAKKSTRIRTRFADFLFWADIHYTTTHISHMSYIIVKWRKCILILFVQSEIYSTSQSYYYVATGLEMSCQLGVRKIVYYNVKVTLLKCHTSHNKYRTFFTVASTLRVSWVGDCRVWLRYEMKVTLWKHKHKEKEKICMNWLPSKAKLKLNANDWIKEVKKERKRMKKRKEFLNCGRE